MQRKWMICSLVILAVAMPAFAKKKQAPAPVERVETAPPNPAFEAVIQKMIAREAQNLKALRDRTPIVETYLQEMVADNDVGARPVGDYYMLGRVKYREMTEHQSMLKDGDDAPEEKVESHFKWKIIPTRLPKLSLPKFGLGHKQETTAQYAPEGFAHTAIIDSRGLDRANYNYEFVTREFVGELRCIVIDVSPKPEAGEGRFLGRLWVEDRDYNIVRYNGTYSPRSRKGLYLHFDTWRLNLQPGVWLPAYIYSEESDLATEWAKHVRFKSQTRIWAYNVYKERAQNTFTQITVDTNVNDQSAGAQDLSPVASQRAWERQAEDNVLNRMERGGLLAKAGDVDSVLTTVLNNLVITNNLTIEPELRARVMLTTPVETFAVGHTIVVSRGLIDVLPDEACLAAVMANEVAHIVLGHRIDTRFAFDDRLIFEDAAALRMLRFERNSVEQAAADKKALELLQNSPYKDKLQQVGLFLRQLQERRTVLPELVQSRMGNALLMDNRLRLTPIMEGADKLVPTKVDQIAALPLGGRIKVDPWSNKIEMVKTKPTAILSASEKMPLEITPIFPYLSRFAGAGAQTNEPLAKDPAPSPAAAPPTSETNQQEVTTAAGTQQVVNQR